MFDDKGKRVRAKRIVTHMDPQAEYRMEVRKKLGEACVYHEIPSLYRPGVENNPDLSTGIMLLALHEECLRLQKAINLLIAKKTAVKKKAVAKKKPVVVHKTSEEGKKAMPDLGA